MSLVEPIADKVSPKAIKFFTKPLLTILVSGAIALWALGPIGYIVASWIANGVNLLNTYVSWLVPLVLGGTFPLLVMTGTHYGIIPIGINNRMTTGYDTIVYPANLSSNIAQGAATFAVAIKTKSQEIKQLATSAGITAVCGITEPALYGINMRFKTPLISACIGGAAGGLYVGLLKVKNYAGGSPGLMTLPGYIGGNGFTDLIHACVGAAIAFVVSFATSYMLYKEQEEPTKHLKETDGTNEEVTKRTTVKSETITVCSPATGELVSISKVSDPTFAQEIMGRGMAVIPKEETIVSPINGTVQMVFDTKHAIGFLSEEGAEVLVHVGLDTVNLNGQYFEALVKDGDSVQVGTPVLKVDLKGIQKAGYEIVTPVIVTNSADYADVIVGEERKIQKAEAIMKVVC